MESQLLFTIFSLRQLCNYWQFLHCFQGLCLQNGLNITKARVQIGSEAVVWALKKARVSCRPSCGQESHVDFPGMSAEKMHCSTKLPELCCSWRQTLFVYAKILSYQDKWQCIKFYRKIPFMSISIYIYYILILYHFLHCKRLKIFLPHFLHCRRLKIFLPQRIIVKNQERF